MRTTPSLVDVSENDVRVSRQVQHLLRESILFEGKITSVRRKLCVLAIAYLMLLIGTYVAHSMFKLLVLPKLYPHAFKWYFSKFDASYPLSRHKRKEPPGEAFRSMWDVVNGLEYSMFQHVLNAMALEKSISRSQAEFLLLTAQNFAVRKIEITADMWDYDGIRYGMESPWYTGLATWLPRGGNAMGEATKVSDVAWMSWQATAGANPFFALFPSDKDAFFRLRVIKEYLFYRRGRMTSDLEYLYFGGLCYAAQMCCTDYEGGRTLFLKFFAVTEFKSVSCNARVAGGAVSGMTSGLATGGGIAMLAMEAGAGPIGAIVGTLVVGAVNAVMGGIVAKAKCKSHEEDKFGKHT